MRKVVSVLVCILSLALLFGCAGAGSALGSDQVLSVRNRSNGKILTVGDTQDTVNEVTGGEEANYLDFTGDGVHRANYWNAEGVWVDTLDGKVVALSLAGDDKWEICSGARAGMDKDKAWDLYKDNALAEEGLMGGILLAYDENLTQIPFDPEAYYIITISFEENKVDYIGIQSRIEKNNPSETV